MEDLLICRTCLKTNLSQSNCVNILNKCTTNENRLKNMLETFMPEMDLDISAGETVICLKCCETLNNAYAFKNICLQTEEKIYDYLHLHNIQLGEKINLNEILDHKVIDFKFVSNITSTDLPCKPPSEEELIGGDSVQDISDSDQSDSVLSEAEDNKQVKSEGRRKLRKRKTAPAKNSKMRRDYNSLKRNYTCDMCEYKAYRLDLLETHKQKHNKKILNVKEYKCDFCMYSTLRKRALDRHLFTHKGNSQHLCNVCNKTFAEKYQLKLHVLTHTGQELPHKCQECGKGYLTKSYLKQHMETRHLAKKKSHYLKCGQEKCEHIFSRYYKCDVCDSSFSDKRGLDAHKFTHTGGEFPFKCLHCGFSTAWKGNLKKHLKKKH